MSKKRVFDQDLGVELVLDEDTDEGGRKRTKFENTNQANYMPLEEDEVIDYGEEDDENENLSDPTSSLHSTDGESETERTEQEESNRGTEKFNEEQNDLDESERDKEEEEEEEEEDDEGKEEEKFAQEKCKYWPSCNAGNECSYYHPTKPCRAFPNCRFGEKCLYIHPPCKFNPCTRPNCPFAHPISISAAKRQPYSHPKAAQQSLAPRCKYGFNCMNLMCKFSHQRSEPCRFGANCLLDTCPYTHPSNVVRKKPANAFKWSAQS